MMVPAPLKCPITLETPPLCPQITPCGHVFSFPGIMAHLITNGGDALRKASPCPLCNAPVAARELRLCRVHITPTPQVSFILCMTFYLQITSFWLEGSLKPCVKFCFDRPLERHECPLADALKC